MILLRRILPIVCSLGLLLVLETMMAKQQLFWYLLPLSVVLTIFPVGMIMNWRIEHLDIWSFLITPVVLVGSSLFLLMFISDHILAHALILLSCLLFWWYAENVFLFHYRATEYQPYALEHITVYISLFSVFYLYGALYATRVFLHFPLVWLVFAGAGVSALFAVLMMISCKISWRQDRTLIMAVTLMLLELFLAVCVLPTTFYVAGLLMAIPYYLVTNFTRHMLRKTISRTVIIRNASIGIASITLTLLAAPWT